MITARCYVTSIQRHAWNRDAVTVELAAATRGEENKAWAAATPVFSCKLVVLNGAASKLYEEAFETGSDLAVTFDLMPDPAPLG